MKELSRGEGAQQQKGNLGRDIGYADISISQIHGVIDSCSQGSISKQTYSCHKGKSVVQGERGQLEVMEWKRSDESGGIITKMGSGLCQLMEGLSQQRNNQLSDSQNQQEDSQHQWTKCHKSKTARVKTQRQIRGAGKLAQVEEQKKKRKEREEPDGKNGLDGICKMRKTQGREEVMEDEFITLADAEVPPQHRND